MKSSRDLSIKERIGIIGIDSADIILEVLHKRLNDPRVDPILILFATACIFTNSSTTDIRTIMQIDPEKYKNARVSMVIESILLEAAKIKGDK
jgi:hypothetical protein